VYFPDHEFKKPLMVSVVLRQMLERVRADAGIPMVITGSWRARKGPKRKSAHQTNSKGEYHGVDVRVRGSRQRFLILRAALRAGFNRIGVYNMHLHLDVAKGVGFDQNVIWWGRSK